MRPVNACATTTVAASAGVLSRGVLKEPGRCDEERHEEAVQPDELRNRAAGGVLLSGDERDHGDQHLRERRRGIRPLG
jgi:hypothetical protein